MNAMPDHDDMPPLPDLIVSTYPAWKPDSTASDNYTGRLVSVWRIADEYGAGLLAPAIEGLFRAVSRHTTGDDYIVTTCLRLISEERNRENAQVLFTDETILPPLDIPPDDPCRVAARSLIVLLITMGMDPDPFVDSTSANPGGRKEWQIFRT
ncbi:hypothetical protein FF098_004380 [Parvularcula flava]|uniref:Uncharacterized protein n=1 Tax=Aquisalinus luteolus TaxID=1566827 RepID=A0A8J3A0Y8_9PROT|nr:hypothetical protein [Aquisalinus luteolus]NHK27137.1 hypothetical protein [Aquisalinus luteolus]GGH94512.1 hypothetical protein GCM10011355_08870 [Aquisalinus luteolus]